MQSIALGHWNIRERRSAILHAPKVKLEAAVLREHFLYAPSATAASHHAAYSPRRDLVSDPMVHMVTPPDRNCLAGRRGQAHRVRGGGGGGARMVAAVEGEEGDEDEGGQPTFTDAQTHPSPPARAGRAYRSPRLPTARPATKAPQARRRSDGRRYCRRAAAQPRASDRRAASAAGPTVIPSHQSPPHAHRRADGLSRLRIVKNVRAAAKHRRQNKPGPIRDRPTARAVAEPPRKMRPRRVPSSAAAAFAVAQARTLRRGAAAAAEGT